MTPLENTLATEMFGISVVGTVLTDEQIKQVTAAAEVAKRYIEKAFMANEPAEYCGQDEFRTELRTWLIENGIIFGSGLEESRENTLLQPTKTVENLVVSNGITSTE